MEQSLTDLAYSNTDATKEQVRSAIRAAKVIMTRPLPLTRAFPKIALVGYREEETGRYKLLREIRVFQTEKGFAAMTALEGHTRLIALPILTEEEYRSVRPEDIPDYRVYETIDAAGSENPEKERE